MPENLLPHEARMVFIMKIVRQAVVDYQSAYVKKNRPVIWEDAKNFIFEKNRLEEFFELYHMQGTVNCSSIRKKARYVKIDMQGVLK